MTRAEKREALRARCAAADTADKLAARAVKAAIKRAENRATHYRGVAAAALRVEAAALREVEILRSGEAVPAPVVRILRGRDGSARMATPGEAAGVLAALAKLGAGR